MSRIGISAGDPAGIGLETVLTSLPPLIGEAVWVLYAHRPDFEANRERFGAAIPWIAVSDAADAQPQTLNVVFAPGSGFTRTEWGEGSTDTVAGPGNDLDRATAAAIAGHIDGLVTAPLSKELVGDGFTGQTEYLRDSAGSELVAMSFFTPTFKVVLATTHVSLRESLDLLTVQGYLRLLDLTVSELAAYGVDAPRIAISAINPHAGEGGLFGKEDDEILVPVVEKARACGYDVTGPHSADSLYYRAHQGEFDVVVAPYHDQGLIPVKLIAPRSAANVTLGLPFVRTSPDHGTAFSIAGRGIADSGGMGTAMRWAIDLVARKKVDRPG